MSEFNLYDGNNNSNDDLRFYNPPVENYYQGSSKAARRAARYAGVYDVLTTQQYYAAISIALVWGFALNYIFIKIFGDAAAQMNPILMIIGYFVSCLTGSVLCKRSNNPAICFIGYNLIVLPIGVVLSLFVTAYSATLLSTAFLATALVTVGMMILAFIYPDVFRSIGLSLCAALLITLVVDIILSLIGVGTSFIDYVVAFIFSLYIGYDLAIAQLRPKTIGSAIDVAAELYLDIINLFIRILSIMARNKD